jgi:hypothetical protein
MHWSRFGVWNSAQYAMRLQGALAAKRFEIQGKTAPVFLREPELLSAHNLPNVRACWQKRKRCS